jgi:CHAD domain-containing protein
VLIARLNSAAGSLPPGEHAVAGQALELLRRERDEARDALLDVLGSARYLELLDALVDGAHEPRLSDDASRRASKVLPRLVRRPWRKLRRTVRALGEHPSDGELHGVRIRAKRARYAAAVAAPVIGAHADALEEALGSLQDVLGEHHDAVVAEEWLRSSATGPYTDGPDALVVGELIGLQRADATARRAEWPAKWKAARKSGRARWLS